MTTIRASLPVTANCSACPPSRVSTAVNVSRDHALAVDDASHVRMEPIHIEVPWINWLFCLAEYCGLSAVVIGGGAWPDSGLVAHKALHSPRPLCGSVNTFSLT